MKRKLKIIAGCRDPGSCNAIYPVVRELRSQGEDVVLFASGYSVEILKKRDIPFSKISIQNFNQVDRLFDREKPNIILVGTAMEYSPEKAFVERARKRNIPSIAVLDSWVNYSVRFSDLTTGERFKYLPDIVCVMDEFAKQEMMAEGVSLDRIRVTGNPYFDDLIEEVSTYPPERKKQFLERWGFTSETTILSFFSQRIDKTFGTSKENPLYLGYVQLDALELLIAALKEIMKENGCCVSLVVRPHPKEKKRLYEQFKNKVKDISLVIDDEKGSREILAISDIVAGMFSTILVEAYILGRNIISIQPSLSVSDPFILSRLGIIKTATSFRGLKKQLEAALSRNQVISSRLKAFQIGRATDNIMNIIYKLASR